MYNKDNIFAKIIAGELQTQKVFEDDKIIAINDINPVAPIHVIVIPKGEYVDYSDFVTKADVETLKHYFTKIVEIADNLGLGNDGYRLVTNKGSKSGQTIFHFHTHIIGGRPLSKLA